MKRIELTIARDYCPSWGVWEGVREFIQNWLDARDADGGDGHSFGHGANVLTFWNPRSRLDISRVVLVGNSTKPGTEARGQFGEGMKIGMLALARLGCQIRIECQMDVWKAYLCPSRQFEGEVLTVSQSEAIAPIDGVLVTITGISNADWCEIHGRVLWEGGDSCLVDRRGKVFVKDIWVQDAKVAYGYNLGGVSVDRDRRLVGSFDLKYYTAMALSHALSAGRVTAADVYQVLIGGTIDAECLPSMLNGDQREALIEEFERIHGSGVVPVSNDAEGAIVEHAGLEPTIQPRPLVEAIAQAIVKRRDKEMGRWELVEIGAAAADTLAWARELTGCLAETFVVRFVGDRTLGMTDGRRILVSEKALADRWAVIKILVEEQAHIDSQAGDGTLNHKHAIHDRYIEIVKKVVA